MARVVPCAVGVLFFLAIVARSAERATLEVEQAEAQKKSDRLRQLSAEVFNAEIVEDVA